LPHNTRRRRYYDLGLKGGRIIANNGIKRFIWEIKHYMNRGNRIENKLPDENNQNNYVNLKYTPKISIILPTWNTPEKWLYQSINSVLSQDYPNWELCIADGGSDKPHVKAILSEYLKKDRRIKIKFLSENKGISRNSNEAFAIATGKFITLLDHDDELSSDALFEAVKLLNRDPHVEVIFSDEDKISVEGKYIDPFYKPAFSLELLRSMNYLIHGIFIKKNLIETTGFFDPHFDGAQDFDLFFRIVEKNPKIAHIPKILYHWRMSEQSGAQDALAKPWIYERGRESVENHLRRLKIDAEVTVGRGWGLYTINYNLKNSPYVDIIIPTRKIEMLKNCLKFLEKSTYKNYRVYAVINGSTDYEVIEINNFDTSKIDPFVDPKTGLIGLSYPTTGQE
jgi:glycosyltransferase involved in cell wall biosynthesis